MEWRIWIIWWTYSISDIQDYFEYTLKKKAVNPSIRICINKIENIITIKTKAGYYLEHLTPETKELLGSTKSKIAKNEKGEDLPHVENTEVVLVYCKPVNNIHQQNRRVLYAFVLNKSFGKLLDVSPKILYI